VGSLFFLEVIQLLSCSVSSGFASLAIGAVAGYRQRLSGLAALAFPLSTCIPVSLLSTFQLSTYPPTW